LKALISLAVALTVIPAAHAAVSTVPPPAPASTPAQAASPPPGVTPSTGTTLLGSDQLRLRVEQLTARARAQARRLGLSTASMGDVPDRPELLLRREDRLTSVIGFLERRREVPSAVDQRPRRAAAPRGSALAARITRQHSLAVQHSLALGVDRPGPLKLAATRQGRSAQLSHWQTVSSWLTARTEKVRPAERPLSETLEYYDELTCIASHESHGTWDISTGNGYYGGLQMDRSFQQTYAPGLYRAKGTADNWTKPEQMRTAGRAIATRGFHPWPNTARMCGLIA